MTGGKGSRRPDQTRVALLCGLALLALGAVIAGIYLVGRHIENSRYQETRGVMSEGFGQMPTAVYQGKTYAMKPAVTTLLLIGTDKTEETQSFGFRKGGQADFLSLLVIDHNDKTVRQLQIDRDTMTDVVTLGVLGNEVGTRRMQICLSHSFGAQEAESSRYTVRAVQNLLQGFELGFYLSMDLRAIADLNDLLGGVTVTLEDDLSALDPAMTAGKTLRLTGAQAEAFVRARMTVGDGTNASRMRRQRAYMASAAQTLQTLVGQGAGDTGALCDQLLTVCHTDMPRGRLVNEVNLASQYDILPVQTLTGEYRIGEDGFMECHVSEETVLAWIMDALYTPKP